MLDPKFIRENAELVKTAASHKNLNPQVVDNYLDADKKRRELIVKVEDIRAQRNLLNDKLKSERSPELIAQSTDLKQQLQDLEPQLKQLDETATSLLLQIPNVPLDDVPVGPDSSGNIEVKVWGDKPEFPFTPKSHEEIGADLDLIDTQRGAKVAGFRGYFLKNEAVLLELALMHYALNKLIAKGFTPLHPPIINRRQAFVNTGHFPWGESEAYRLSEDETDPDNDYFLSGTAEVPLANYFAGETLTEKELPFKLVGFSPCYRREIGSYGKDTKGIYRVHEFMKVEQFIIAPANLDTSRRLHEELLQNSEELLQELNLPYRVLLMCTGDMGEPQAKKYDLEVWMPGRGDYGEVMSNSIMTDFQSRRANVRYQAKDGSLKYAYMLNNTALASVRMIIAILENYQQPDGTVKVPAPLVPFLGKEIIGR